MCIPVTMWVCAIFHATIVYFECSIYVVNKTMEISVFRLCQSIFRYDNTTVYFVLLMYM